jgi:5-methyltetrahydrofolate--homocysteine methyltransferase
MSLSIDFNMWERVKENHRLWWEGKLKRPLIHVILEGGAPKRPEPSLPCHNFAAFYDMNVPEEAVVDVWDYQLSTRRYLGDAFPAVWPNFGAGVLAAFIGADVRIDKRTVWFFPPEEKGIQDLQFLPDPDNPWLRRIKKLCNAAMERWEGLVQVGMTDLGGNLDILSVFRPSEQLLLDLYDYPERVKELHWEAHRLWWKFFEEINRVLRGANPGYTAWTPIFSEAPYYMLQCDFCYMIGPGMFDEFVKPELEASCSRLVNPFYHLDGPGQIAHLDSILQIQELKGVQWVPGDGQPDCSHWPQIYRKIREEGKLIQVLGNLDTLDAVVEQLGSGEGIVLICSEPASREEEVKDRLNKYGALS